MDADTFGLIAIVVLLLFEIALLCGFLTIVHSLSSADIEKNEEIIGTKLSCKLRKIIENERAYINRALIAVIIVSMFAGSIGLPILYDICFGLVNENLSYMPAFFKEIPILALTGIFYAAVVFVVLMIMLIFTVLIPRRFVGHVKFKTRARIASFAICTSVIFEPLSNFANYIAKGILCLFGISKNAEETDVTEEEIISMVNEGQELGVLEADEAEMITNIFEYGEKEAKDIMTNRNNIVAIDGQMTLPEAIQFMLEEKYSRYPVYEENLDHVIGILHFKDVIRFHNANERNCMKLADCPMLVREPLFVPETKNIDDLFQDMQSRKLQMVIVADEYGQTSGLVAMEDILEEIVGNILDEYDEEEEYIEEKGENKYEIDGLTPLKELEEELDIVFENEYFETLNGFLISKLEHIPADGEEFEFDYAGYHFKALETVNRMFKTVSVIQNTEALQNTEEIIAIEDEVKLVEESNK